MALCGRAVTFDRHRLFIAKRHRNYITVTRVRSVMDDVQRLVNSVTRWTLAKVLPVFIYQTLGAIASWSTMHVLLWLFTLNTKLLIMLIKRR